jgi:hypothetical protein
MTVDAVASHMDRIMELFKPGRKITVAIRTPDAPSQDFLMTNDDLEEVIAMLCRR